MTTVLLLVASNLFMTAAWYGHLRWSHLPMGSAILLAWGIAFFEYVLQVPANRWAYGDWSAWQLKIVQEVISVAVFAAFAMAWLGERPRWNHVVAALFLVGAVTAAFYTPAAR